MNRIATFCGQRIELSIDQLDDLYAGMGTAIAGLKTQAGAHV